MHLLIGTRSRGVALLAAAVAVATLVGTSPVDAAPKHPAPVSAPDFGPNVTIFDPTMPIGRDPGDPRRAWPRSRSTTRWAPNRTRCCSCPATTAPPTQPLQIKVGYYTEVAGLGAQPDDVVDQRQGRGLQPLPRRRRHEQLPGARSTSGAPCPTSRSHVNAAGQDGCRASANFWAVSQAVSMRRRRRHRRQPVADGLLHRRPAVRQRRLHRRLAAADRRSTGRSSSG